MDRTTWGVAPEVPVEDMPASSLDRHERWLVSTMTANGQLVLAAAGQIVMSANTMGCGWYRVVPEQLDARAAVLG